MTIHWGADSILLSWNERGLTSTKVEINVNVFTVTIQLEKCKVCRDILKKSYNIYRNSALPQDKDIKGNV